MDVKLIVVVGKAKGRAIPLPSTVVTIGRGQDCHLRPHCRLVSKLHCAIARWAGKVVVRDLKSCNGTFVNEQRVHGEIQVKDGDMLRIGTLRFTLQIQASSEEVPTLQVVRPSDVKWLLDKPCPAALASSDTCSDREYASFFEATGAGSGAPGSAPELSAGDHLRAYFRKPR